jgi:hypothetical protein
VLALLALRLLSASVTCTMGQLKSSVSNGFVLRPGVTNVELWYPERPPKAEWDRIRKIVLERDNYTCTSCGHRALKWMNVHHLEESGENKPENLGTMCVACHAVLHIGMNLGLGVIEIWKSELSQVEIVQKSRAGVKNGLPLAQIAKTLKLKRGPHAPDSILYANELIRDMGSSPRGYLPKPLCAVFVKLSRWQLE